MLTGSAFHAVGPATVKERLLNLERVRGMSGEMTRPIPETGSTCRVGHRDAAVNDILWCKMVEDIEYHK